MSGNFILLDACLVLIFFSTPFHNLPQPESAHALPRPLSISKFFCQLQMRAFLSCNVCAKDTKKFVVFPLYFGLEVGLYDGLLSSLALGEMFFLHFAFSLQFQTGLLQTLPTLYSFQSVGDLFALGHGIPLSCMFICSQDRLTCLAGIYVHPGQQCHRCHRVFQRKEATTGKGKP